MKCILITLQDRKYKNRPTQRAADGWVRTGKLAFSRLMVGSVALIGSPHPPLTPTVETVEKVGESSTMQ
jgi:hypothetical protein